jgi:hypothetical protein
LKRYRCIDCRAVHTLRPKSHWRRFQATVAGMVQSLRTKIVDNRWVTDFTRQRQQYWLSGFKKQTALHYTCPGCTTFRHLKKLLTQNIIAATHSLRWFKMALQGPWAVVVPV